MTNQLRRLIRSFLLIGLSALLVITACNKVETPTNSVSVETTNPECRIVQHKLGETCIPTQPQRVVALDSASIPDMLLSLDIKPIGITYTPHLGRELFHGLSADDIAGIELVGSRLQPSIEKILSLQPDLIMSPENGEQIYDQLSKIAPTVILEGNESTFSIEKSLRTVAKILEREDKAEQVLNDYQSRVERLKTRLEQQLEAVEISFIIYNGGNFYVPANYATFFQVLTDIGATIKPILLEGNEWLSISVEAISEYDADVLFILNPDNKPASFFLENPLISQLESVKNNQAYVVDVINWVPYGPLGANKLLDELPKYLSQVSDLS